MKEQIILVFFIQEMFSFSRCVRSDVVYTEILFLLSWVSCQLEIALTRLRLVRSRTQTHSANCRLVLHTPDQNHREDDCGFNGQRKQRGPQKQT